MQECTELQRHGIVFEDTVYPFSIVAFISDAPARAFIKSVKGHSGYHACEQCEVRGNYVENRVTYAGEHNNIPRTDIDFNLNAYQHHEIGVSPLSQWDIPVYLDFP